MLSIYRYIPAAPKVPPAPKAKPVKNAARNTTFPVTTGARGRLTATARTPAYARTPTATQKKRTYPAAATPTRPASGRERAPLAEGVTTAVTTWCISVQKPPPVRKSAGTLTSAASAATIPPAKSCPHSMIWSSTQQKPLPVRKRAGMLTKPAPVVTIPPMRNCPR